MKFCMFNQNVLSFLRIYGAVDLHLKVALFTYWLRRIRTLCCGRK